MHLNFLYEKEILNMETKHWPLSKFEDFQIPFLVCVKYMLYDTMPQGILMQNFSNRSASSQQPTDSYQPASSI